MFKTHLEKFKTVTDKNSRGLSYRKLEYLNKKIRRKMMNHTYSHPTGYDEYIKDVEWVIKQFNSNVPYLGTQVGLFSHQYSCWKSTILKKPSFKETFCNDNNSCAFQPVLKPLKSTFDKDLIFCPDDWIKKTQYICFQTQSFGYLTWWGLLVPKYILFKNKILNFR